MELNSHLKYLIYSFFISSIVVSLLVGNAYMSSVIGYPWVILDLLGLALMMVSAIIALPPAIVYSLLSLIGVFPELRGRETFVESNPELWIFCAIFYTVYMYFGFKNTNTEQKKR